MCACCERERETGVGGGGEKHHLGRWVVIFVCVYKRVSG